MTDILPLSIGLGLFIGFLFTELFGISSGGLVVPGYIALYLHEPVHIIVTICIALLSYLIVRILAMFMLIYGRRRTAMMILIGYILGMLVRQHTSIIWQFEEGATVIGFIIPGLIATWMDRQGIFQTIAAMLTISIIVKLLLVIMGVEVPL